MGLNIILQKIYGTNLVDKPFSHLKINPGLILQKLVNLKIIEKAKIKKDFLNAFVNLKYSQIYNSEITNRINRHIQNQLQQFQSYGYQIIINQSLITQSRLVVGLGGESVLETSLTLHKIFGIPYIPATALKGVCRMLTFWEIAHENEILKIEDEKEKNKKLKSLQEKFYDELQVNDEDVLKAQLLFGAQNFKGLLVFLDAYPEIENNEPLFELDIMNVHYPKYYSENEPPGDWQNPNPIYFLTVKPGVKFRIGVLFDKYRYNNLNNDLKKLDINNLKNNIESLIKEALSEFGIGAKTRLGYGVLAE